MKRYYYKSTMELQLGFLRAINYFKLIQQSIIVMQIHFKLKQNTIRIL